MGQAVEYADIPGASGYFIIGYPDELRDKIRQGRIGTASPALLLHGVTYRTCNGESPRGNDENSLQFSKLNGVRDVGLQDSSVFASDKLLK